jgi:glycerol-3-phosphate acyltransferase PlsY
MEKRLRTFGRLLGWAMWLLELAKGFFSFVLCVSIKIVDHNVVVGMALAERTLLFDVAAVLHILAGVRCVDV